jgi:PST family polysaccharide transporter
MAPEMPTTKMDNSLIRSLAWSATGDWVSQIFTWGAFLVILRLLAPSDFGIVALVASFQPFLSYVSGFGIPRAVVTLRHLSDEQLAQLNTLGILLGLAGFGLAVLAAEPVALFFRMPHLAAVMVVSCLTLVTNGIQSVSNGLLAKNMRFRTLSLLNATSASIAAIVTLLLAWLHFGYWALVLGNLSAALVRTILVILSRGQTYAIPKLGMLQEPLKFGWHVLVSLIALNSYQNLDNLTAGRMLGQTALGFYGMAWSLANVPLEKITSLITTVIPTYLASLRNDLPAIRRYVRGITGNLSLVTFPACVGLGVVAPEFVPLVMGHKWIGAVPPLEILAIYAAFRSIVALLSKVLTALGNPRFVMWNDLASVVVLGTAFYIGSHWGVTGIAWAWVVAYPPLVIPMFRKTFLSIEMSVGEYFRCVVPALQGTIFMTVVVEGVRYALSRSERTSLKLLIEVVAGAASYIGILLLFHRKRAVAFLQLARTFGRQSGAPSV